MGGIVVGEGGAGAERQGTGGGRHGQGDAQASLHGDS
jgi:hypothetical protein